MPYAKIESSGCGIVKDVTKLRIDCFLNPDDPNYDRCYVNVPVIPPEGYQGKVDKEGTPKDQKDYDAWIKSLPHVWRNNPFHSHMIWLPKEPTDNFIKEQIERTLTYFYNFHQHVWDTGQQFCGKDKDGKIVGLWERVPKVKGSIRDVFVKGDPKDYSINEARVQDIVSRVLEFQISGRVPPTDLNIGEKGTIDVGVTPDDFNIYFAANYTAFHEDNPANADGTIDTVQYWFDANKENVHGVIVGFFFNVSGTTYECRSSESIGDVAKGSLQQTTGLELSVSTNDFIGWYSTAGRLETSSNLGGIAYNYTSGEHIGATDQAVYSHRRTERLFALYGTGTESGEVIPGTLALVITLYAPTVTASNHITVTPSTLALAITLYEPTIILGTVATPSTLALTLTTFAPTATTTDNQTVIPATLALVLTTYAPTVTATDNVEVTPSTATMTLTEYAPVIGLKIIPPTLALSDTEYAPVIKLGIIPPIKALTLTEYAPTVSTPRLATPITKAVTVTAYAPTVTATGNVEVTPSTATLILTEYAPVIQLKVIPPVLALTLTEYAPVIGLKVIPGTLALSDTEYAPVIKLGVTPTTATLTLTTYAPTVSTTDNQTVIPATLALVLTTYAPTVTATGNVEVTPSILALVITTYAPTVTVSNNITVTPTTLALTLTTFAPSVLTPILATPSTLALTITTYAPTVLTPAVVIPPILALILTQYAPTVLAPRLVTPETLALLLTFYAPQLFGGDFPLPEGGGRYGTNPTDTDTGTSVSTGGRYG